jgi:hypothetical protein
MKALFKSYYAFGSRPWRKRHPFGNPEPVKGKGVPEQLF